MRRMGHGACIRKDDHDHDHFTACALVGRYRAPMTLRPLENTTSPNVGSDSSCSCSCLQVIVDQTGVSCDTDFVAHTLSAVARQLDTHLSERAWLTALYGAPGRASMRCGARRWGRWTSDHLSSIDKPRLAPQTRVESSPVHTTT